MSQNDTENYNATVETLLIQGLSVRDAHKQAQTNCVQMPRTAL